MSSRLSKAGRATVVAIAALVVGFVALTALGVGGSDEKSSTTAAQQTAPAKPKTAIQKYSEEISVREGGGSPTLSEEPPISPKRFDKPIRAYLRYAAAQASLLQTEVATLRSAIGSGNRSAARGAWRVAFARYLRLGAVYGAFGSLDSAIDGQPGGLPDRARDKHFSGLHRIELGLWSAKAVRSLQPVADRLAHDVARLRKAIPEAKIEPLDYATRAHEILEDAQRDFLSGVDVPWSKEGVLATASGLDATRVVIGTLRPLLGGRDALDPVLLGLSRLGATLTKIRRAHDGRLPTLTTLRTPEREQLDGGVSWVLERLQAIPDALATTDPVQVPSLPKQ